jgi:hypothetical protein
MFLVLSNADQGGTSESRVGHPDVVGVNYTCMQRASRIRPTAGWFGAPRAELD